MRHHRPEFKHNDPQVEHLVGEWEHGSMGRREFFERALFLLGTAAAAEALLAACSPQVTAAPTAVPAAAATATSMPPTAVPPTSAPTLAPTAAPPTAAPTAAPTRSGTAASQPTPVPVTTSMIPGYVDPSAVDGSNVTWQNGDVKMLGYLAKPKSGSGPWPGVIVIHENRGLTDHHMDVARRIANLGYVALAVDFLSRVGGTPKFAAPADPTQAINGLKQGDVDSDTVSAVGYLKTLPTVKPKFGIVGFCWGGGNSLTGAITTKDIVACMVFYGRNPANIDDVQKLNGPVVAGYGEQDTFINPGIPALDAAMKKYNKTYDYKIYPGANHAFFNDTGPRFNEAASKDAWARMVKLYESNLKA
ncbi:MAG: dienelactone hydrolase family protein [Chloroflexi bacterium]|nr:dienelactone hydrolase family protein [Chloroflexota bacterium]